MSTQEVTIRMDAAKYQLLKGLADILDIEVDEIIAQVLQAEIDARKHEIKEMYRRFENDRCKHCGFSQDTGEVQS